MLSQGWKLLVVKLVQSNLNVQDIEGWNCEILNSSLLMIVEMHFSFCYLQGSWKFGEW